MGLADSAAIRGHHSGMDFWACHPDSQSMRLCGPSFFCPRLVILLPHGHVIDYPKLLLAVFALHPRNVGKLLEREGFGRFVSASQYGHATNITRVAYHSHSEKSPEQVGAASSVRRCARSQKSRAKRRDAPDHEYNAALAADVAGSRSRLTCHDRWQNRR